MFDCEVGNAAASFYFFINEPSKYIVFSFCQEWDSLGCRQAFYPSCNFYFKAQSLIQT